MQRHENHSCRAYVVGNIVVDETFRVRDLPKKGQSVLAHSTPLALGGKGANQAISLARAGVHTTLVAAIGSDRYARFARQQLDKEPLNGGLIERADLETDRSIILADQLAENMVITTNTCAQSITLKECVNCLEDARAGDALLLQGNLRSDVTVDLCEVARQRRLLTILNPSPFSAVFGQLLSFADILFVNESEAIDLTGLSKFEAATALRSAGADQVVLTLGKEGSILATRDSMFHVPALKSNALDVTGAGDCFEGIAVASSLLRKTGVDEIALSQASRAAALTVSRMGAVTAFPTLTETAEILQNLQTG